MEQQKDSKEIEILKKKCNAQLDKIIELESTIKTLQKPQNGKSEGIAISIDSKNEVFYFIEFFQKVVQIAIKEKVFIAYNNKSKYSDLYYKIEKDIFENYVKTYLDMEVKTFFEYAVLFSFLKSENKKYVFTSDKMRICFISKVVLEVLGIKGDA